MLVGDYVGLPGTVTPNPFNADATNAAIEHEVFGQANAQITMQVHATKDDERCPAPSGLAVVRKRTLLGTRPWAARPARTAPESRAMRRSADSVHRNPHRG